MKLANLLMKLSNLDALPGQEEQVRLALKEEIQLSSQQDAFGNLYFGNLTPTRKKIAIYAHMDEVGFFVHRITEEGFVYFYPIGGWWGHVILGQTVRATCRKNGYTLKGVVGTLPKENHDMKSVVPINEMYIDFGASSAEELIAAGLQIGDMILPDTIANYTFNQQKIIGKALDNRVACTVMSEVLNQYQGQNCEVIGVATVQEEAGTRGSKVAVKNVDADLNLVIDVANGKDTPKATQFANRILGNGPGLVLADRTALGNLKLLDFIKEIAEEKNLNWQYDLLAGGGTDAGSVQLFNGKPTLVLCIPVRYCHSWHSIVDLKDIQRTIDLILAVLEVLDKRSDIFEQF